MNAQITFKTDADLKQAFTAFVSELGMSVSAALNLFMKDCLQNNEMDEVDCPPALAARIAEARQNFAKGNYISVANSAELDKIVRARLKCTK